MPRRLLYLLPLLAFMLAGCNASTEPPKVGLEVGDLAPPLEGEDLEENVVKLSDHLGKVVVVDFWATWCGPCRQMIPHEKELVQRMEGRPFAFIGVSADRSKGDLKSFLRDSPLPWKNIYDGGRGPLVRKWQIEYFPSIFVIDAKGVIRYKDLRGAQLDRAVDKLVAEAEGK